MNVRSKLVTAAMCLSLAAAGCVTGPNHGDSIADRHTDTFDFAGFAYKPNQYLRIQALHDDDGWVTIATAWSSGSAFNWNGMQLYAWSKANVQIPLHHYWEHTAHPAFDHECEVRVIDPNGYGLATFDQNYPSALDALGMTVADLWNLAGHGTTMTLYSEN